jgi:hypothetical protein
VRNLRKEVVIPDNLAALLPCSLTARRLAPSALGFYFFAAHALPMVVNRCPDPMKQTKPRINDPERFCLFGEHEEYLALLVWFAPHIIAIVLSLIL